MQEADAPLPDDVLRARLHAFAGAADAVGRHELAAGARTLTPGPLQADAVRALAQRVTPPALPSGLNPKALDSGVWPATEEVRTAFEREQELYDAALDLRERAPRRQRGWWRRR
jgi:hypothetical protein